MRRVLPYIVIVLAIASCTKNERIFPDANKGRRAIAFSTTTEPTKADVTLADLKASGEGWGLYGYYTGTSNYTKPGDAEGIIFNERKVSWIGGVWDYSLDQNHRKEYWPMDPDENVSFFAYAPYLEYHGQASVDADGGPQVTYIATTDLSAQKDLLWATNTSGLPHRNVNMATYADSIVDMHFRHAPAKIHFTINGATLGDNSTPLRLTSDNTTGPTNGTNYEYGTQAVGTFRYNNRNYDTYYAYRTVTTVVRRVYSQSIDGFKILVNTVDMTNFIARGILHLNNPDAFNPYWTDSGAGSLTYSFNTSGLNTAIINPDNESALSRHWDTYLGVDSDPTELLPVPDNYIYMVPKEADTLSVNSNNIKITVTYHVIGLSNELQMTETTTNTRYQKVEFYTRNNGTKYYRTGNNAFGTSNAAANNVQWTDCVDAEESADHRSGTVTDTTYVEDPHFNYSQDNGGLGFRAEGSINSNILGGRDYTINLYLDGRELNLTVIPQQWDLQETVYDYNTFINPVIQSLTYDSDFVYDVIGSNVYINNRMGKFYFKLGSGMYLYWQASLIGDDAFAFTDEHGEYLRNDDGSLKTTVRGDIGDEMNYIYVKAINTASQVTSKAKLRIYLFNSENRAVVALPQNNWLFVSSTYIDGEGHQVRVQEWNVVQTAN